MTGRAAPVSRFASARQVVLVSFVCCPQSKVRVCVRVSLVRGSHFLKARSKRLGSESSARLFLLLEP